MKRRRILLAFSIVAVLIISIGCLMPFESRVVNNQVVTDCYGNITPCTTNTYDIGSATEYWHDGYIEETHTETVTPSGDFYVNCPPDHTLELISPVWDDVSIAMAQVRQPASSAPTWTPYKGSQVPAFSPTQINALYFSAQLPHSYLEGTDIEFHIHIAYPDNGAGNSVWYFTYSWANDGDPFPDPTMSPQVIIASPTVANNHQLAEIIAVMDGTNKEISSVLICMIQRTGTHVSDTYASDIYLVSGDFHFMKDTLGSRMEFTK